MAAIAGAAGISRETLYRYYPDIDAVLVGIATSLASHDDAFEAHARQQADHRDLRDVRPHSSLRPTRRRLMGRQARDILTTGVDPLARAGAERISIGYEPDNPASGHLHAASASNRRPEPMCTPAEHDPMTGTQAV